MNDPAPWGPAPATTPNQGGWGGAPGAPQPSQPAWGSPAPQAATPASAPQSGRRGAMGAPTLVEKAGKNPGAEYAITKDRTTIGRHRDSDIFLEDLAVSRLHTSITRDPSGQCVLRDENSANGTLVNGQRVSEQVLRDGDEIQVGQTTLVFRGH
jgi:pSer/pThr/pTyr-binding forkhead associated (FHA) protein